MIHIKSVSFLKCLGHISVHKYILEQHETPIFRLEILMLY